MLPFGKTKALESKVDEFLDLIAKGGLVLVEAIKAYLRSDDEEFDRHLEAISELESHADDLRKHSETMLYQHSLIPDSRGDVLGLLETMDNVIDQTKDVLQHFDVQRPDIPEEYDELFVMLTNQSMLAIDNVVSAARCFFRDVRLVKDYINKVDFHESEADQIGVRLKKQIFSSDLKLSSKLHLSSFVDQLESLSDMSESVAERLAIATIKRSI